MSYTKAMIIYLLSELGRFYFHVIDLSSACMLSCFSSIRLFGTPWTVARQAPLPMGFSRQEHWSGLPRPPPEECKCYFPKTKGK